MAEGTNPDDRFEAGAAAKTVVSLSQVVLAPMDALLKAQVHAARSFLNFVLQVGYPHKKDEPRRPAATPPPETPPPDADKPEMYMEEFRFPHGPDGSVTIRVPTLALVPVRPLAIEDAEFDVEMLISDIAPHQQIRSSVREEYGLDKKPRWFLVDEPISIRGVLAPFRAGEERPAAEEETAANAPQGTQPHTSIKIHVKVGRTEVPAGLNKLLTALVQEAVLPPPSGESPAVTPPNPK